METNVVSPVTGRPGIIVGQTPYGPAIQEMAEWKGRVPYVPQYVQLLCSFQRTDGRGPLLHSGDGWVGLPPTLAQQLILIGAARQSDLTAYVLPWSGPYVVDGVAGSDI